MEMAQHRVTKRQIPLAATEPQLFKQSQRRRQGKMAFYTGFIFRPKEQDWEFMNPHGDAGKTLSSKVANAGNASFDHDLGLIERPRWEGYDGYRAIGS